MLKHLRPGFEILESRETPANLPPVNTLPVGPLVVNEDASLPIAGLSISDADAGTATVSVTLQVFHGSLVVNDAVIGGVTGDQVQLNNSDIVVITAPIAEINTTLGSASGLVYLPEPNFAGADSLVMLTNDLGNTGTPGPLVDLDTLAITVVQQGGMVAVGADVGSQPFVKVFDPVTNDLLFQIQAYAPTFSGGVRVALADVNGDTRPDIITLPGPGMVAEVKVFDGTNGAPLAGPLNGLKPFGTTFTKGGFLAAGDVDLDGFTDIVVAPSKGGGGLVRFISGQTGLQAFSFRPYPAAYKGGIQVAVGDVDTASLGLEIVVAPTGALPLKKPSKVRVYASNGLALSGPGRNFVPLAGYKKGFTLALGDLNGVGGMDIILGTMAGAPRVLLVNGDNGQTLLSLNNSTLGLPTTYKGPVRVAFGLEDDGSQVGLYTATGAGAPPALNFYSGLTPVLVDSFQPHDGFNGFWIAASL